MFDYIIYGCFSLIDCMASMQPSAMILKLQDAMDLKTDTFGPDKCKEKKKFKSTLRQLDEWIEIMEDEDSLEQYKVSLMNLLATIDESRQYSNENTGDAAAANDSLEKIKIIDPLKEKKEEKEEGNQVIDGSEEQKDSNELKDS